MRFYIPTLIATAAVKKRIGNKRIKKDDYLRFIFGVI